MDFHLHYDGPEDMGLHLRLAQEKLIPMLDWLDELTDPERHKVKVALLILIFYDRIKDGAPRELMHTNLDILYDAVTAGELDNVIPFRRPSP